MLGDHSESEPPDPIPNSEVKPLSADEVKAVCPMKVGCAKLLNTTPFYRMIEWGFQVPPKVHSSAISRDHGELSFSLLSLRNRQQRHLIAFQNGFNFGFILSNQFI